jgi:hypothetical protein
MALSSVGLWMHFVLDYSIGDPVESVLVPQFTVASLPFETTNIAELISTPGSIRQP